MTPLVLGCLFGFSAGILLFGAARLGSERSSWDAFAALEALTDPLALSRALRNRSVVAMLRRPGRWERAQKLRVLCSLNDTGGMANFTWLRRCDRRHWTAPGTDPLRHLYLQERHDAHWFVLTGPHAYLLVENLRYAVRDVDPSRPYVLGRTANATQLDFALVLSRGALEHLGREGCLEKLPSCIDRIPVLEERDVVGCRRFFADSLLHAGRTLLNVRPPCLSRAVIAVDRPSVRLVALLEYGSRSLHPYGVVPARSLLV